MRNVDINLKEFATEIQWACYVAYCETGSYQNAANKMGYKNKYSIRDAIKALKKKAEKQGYSPSHDMTKTAPNDFSVDGTSTLYSFEDDDGVKKIQWVKTKRDKLDKQNEQKKFYEALKQELSESIKPAKPVKPPKYTDEKLVTQYNITDYHLGMKAWAEETGANWDLKISEDMLISFFKSAIGLSTKSKVAVFSQIGDFLHYDSSQPKTPTSGHIVDADSRFILMVRVAIRVLKTAINMLLKKHEKVIFLCAEGNHDIYGSALLRESFASLYEDEPRVEVITRPDPFYCITHGNVSTFFHHGHKVKFEQLPDVFAAKFPKEWGTTEHRYGFMGHYHHERSKEFRGILMRQLRTLAAPDAHSSGGGYISGRDSVVITYHSEMGKIREDVITSKMLEIK